MRSVRHDDRLPVLWLYGPPGVGKTTVAWQLFTRLAADGIPTGYVDIDQLGMCYGEPRPDNWAPEPASDPGRYRMKARNLDAVVTNYRAAGAQCLIVSGVIDAERGLNPGTIPHADLTACRLRCEPSDLRRRLASRGRPGDEADEPLRHAETLDRNHATDVCVETTGRSVAEVLQLVRKQTAGWPRLTESTQAPAGTATPRPHGAPGEILWISGPTAVGKSTVGWQIYERVRRAGHQAAYVDLDQIGFCRPINGDHGNHRLKAANLAVLWRNYRAGGTQCLVAVGPVDRPEAIRPYRAALPAATMTLCRLHASREQLAERVMLRGRDGGSTWVIPGDELKGQPAEVLRRVADRAAADAEAQERAAIGDLRVGTDGRPAQDIADEILRRTAWPARGRPAGGRRRGAID